MSGSTHSRAAPSPLHAIIVNADRNRLDSVKLQQRSGLFGSGRQCAAACRPDPPERHRLNAVAVTITDMSGPAETVQALISGVDGPLSSDRLRHYFALELALAVPFVQITEIKYFFPERCPAGKFGAERSADRMAPAGRGRANFRLVRSLSVEPARRASCQRRNNRYCRGLARMGCVMGETSLRPVWDARPEGA